MTRRLAWVRDLAGRGRARPSATAALLDLADPAFRRDPHPIFRRMREVGAVVPIAGGGWAALGHDAIRIMLGDPGRFAVTRTFDSVLSGADGPVHVRSRRAAGSLLGPHDVRTAVDRATAALALRVAAADGQPLDVVATMANPLAVELGAELLGVSAAGLRALADAHDAGDLIGELDRLCSSCSPPASLLDRLDDDLDAARQIHRTLVAASLTTTRRMLPVMVLLLLLRDAEIEQRVRADDAALRAFVNEALRLHPQESPERRVIATTTLCGVELEAGDRVVACLAAGNRDPAVYADPDRVVLDRSSGHLSFGVGSHRCPGASIVRSGLAAGLRVLLDAYPRLRAAEDLAALQWIDETNPPGLARLLVTSA